jgi:hypothetical protein
MMYLLSCLFLKFSSGNYNVSRVDLTWSDKLKRRWVRKLTLAPYTLWPPVPSLLSKSPPWTMKPGIILWKWVPLYPNPLGRSSDDSGFYSSVKVLKGARPGIVHRISGKSMWAMKGTHFSSTKSPEVRSGLSISFPLTILAKRRLSIKRCWSSMSYTATEQKVRG